MRRVPRGFAITTPYTYEDGDPIILYAVKVGDKVYQIEDAGVQIPSLEACGVGVSEGTRGDAFTSLLNEYGLQFDDKAMVVRTAKTPEQEMGEAAIRLLAFLLRLQDFMLLTPDRIRQTWHEDALQSLHMTFDGIANVKEHAPVMPEIGAIPADAVINFHTGGAAGRLFRHD